MERMERIIIHTEGLTKCYGEKTAVSELNLDIVQGEIFGLLGPNGAGKTTTILMLLGLTEPTAGTAGINGMDCTREPIGIKSMVGYLPGSDGLLSGYDRPGKLKIHRPPQRAVRTASGGED